MANLQVTLLTLTAILCAALASTLNNYWWHTLLFAPMGFSIGMLASKAEKWEQAKKQFESAKVKK